jgi:hypothetical protein
MAREPLRVFLLGTAPVGRGQAPAGGRDFGNQALVLGEVRSLVSQVELAMSGFGRAGGGEQGGEGGEAGKGG